MRGRGFADALFMFGMSCSLPVVIALVAALILTKTEPKNLKYP